MRNLTIWLGFLLLLVSGGCEESQQSQLGAATHFESAVQSAAAVSLPSDLAGGTKGAATWLYWHRAVQLTSTWQSRPANVDRLWIADGLARELSRLDRSEVDQEAVVAVLAATVALQKQRQIMSSRQMEAAVNTGASLAPLITFDPMTGQPMYIYGGAAAASGIGNGIASAIEASQEQRGARLSAYATATQARSTLSERYSVDFSHLHVLLPGDHSAAAKDHALTPNLHVKINTWRVKIPDLTITNQSDFDIGSLECTVVVTTMSGRVYKVLAMDDKKLSIGESRTWHRLGIPILSQKDIASVSIESARCTSVP